MYRIGSSFVTNVPHRLKILIGEIGGGRGGTGELSILSTELFWKSKISQKEKKINSTKRREIAT